MKTRKTIITLTVAAAILLASTGAVFAQTETADAPGWGTGTNIDADLDAYMIPAIAEALNMSEADVAAQYAAAACPRLLMAPRP